MYFMANKHRTFFNVIAGIWIRFWSIISSFSFPAHTTTFIHRLRGGKVCKGPIIARTVIIDDSRPGLITVGKNV